MKRVLLFISILAIGCSSTNEMHKAPAVEETPSAKEAVDRSDIDPPSWISSESYEEGGSCYFTGKATEIPVKDDARILALADAMKSISAFIGVRVKARFSQVLQSSMRDESEEIRQDLLSQIDVATDSYIEKARKVDEYWIRYNNDTYDYYYLVSIPEELLDATRAAVRGLRMKAVNASSEEELLCMEGILRLSLNDGHALYRKGQALKNLERDAEALFVFEELKHLNNGPKLDLGKLYADAEIAEPRGMPAFIDLDDIIFRLSPHWNDLTNQLIDMATRSANNARFRISLNEKEFRVSELVDQDFPLLVALHCPETELWFSLIWLDTEEICQLNVSAPAPDVVNKIKRLEYPLDNSEGEILLLGFASEDRNIVDLSGFDISFENCLTRSGIENDRNREMILKLKRLVDHLDSHVAAGSITGTVERFKIIR